MKRSAPFAIQQACREVYAEDAETCVPRLMKERKAPHRVAALLDVSPNAVRSWLLSRGWVFDGAWWVEPVLEQPHA